MSSSPPNFAEGLDPAKFAVSNTDSLNAGLDSVKKQTGDVNFDWSSVHDVLGQLADGPGKYYEAGAKGQGLSAGNETEMQQQDLGAASGASAGKLGHALMQLGSKHSAMQAQQVASADSAQQLQFAQKAQQLKQAEAQARMNIYKQELALKDQKFQIQNAATQAQNGLQVANLQLKNMYNEAVSKAKNAKEMGDIQVSHQNFSTVMNYVGAGLGTVSTIAAAGAQADAQAKADVGINNNINSTLGPLSDSGAATASGYATMYGDSRIADMFNQ